MWCVCVCGFRVCTWCVCVCDVCVVLGVCVVCVCVLYYTVLPAGRVLGFVAHHFCIFVY